MKNILLSIIYLVLVVLGLILLNIGLYYFINDVLFTIFDWFNGLRWWVKLLILFFGGGLIYVTLVNVVEAITKVLGAMIFAHFPQTNFVMIVGLLLPLANACWWVYYTWDYIQNWGLWIVIEFILTASFIFGVHMIFVPPKPQRN